MPPVAGGRVRRRSPFVQWTNCRGKSRPLLSQMGAVRFHSGRRLRETTGHDHAARFARACGEMIVLPEERPLIGLSCSERTGKSLRY
jgi:hypothetical protein